MAKRPLDQPDMANPRQGTFCIRQATGQQELDAVFRFRYEHFFNRFPTGYPGVDHEKRRVFEPHDLKAAHLCAFGEHGELLAVSTAVPATLASIPDAWPGWFGFGVLGAKRLEHTVVSTRMVLHPGVRRTDLFARFHRAILASYREAGHRFAVHYSRPDLVSRYESLGHRQYHVAFQLPTGLLRAPMIMDLRAHANPAEDDALPPDFIHPALYLMQPGQRLEHLRSRLGGAWLESAGMRQLKHLDSALCQAALFRVHDARTLWHSPEEAFLGLVLSGSCAQSHGPAASVSRLIGPGEFVGVGLLDGPGSDCAVSSSTGGVEILIFAPALVRAAAAQAAHVAGPAAIWNRLLLAVADAAAQADTLPPTPIREGTSACGTP
ncbi:MAG: hypothetical protein HY915_02080 [Desulfovibrio sp.]|nr:hypothetical protein [Desulfovibrio sp.]